MYLMTDVSLLLAHKEPRTHGMIFRTRSHPNENCWNYLGTQLESETIFLKRTHIKTKLTIEISHKIVLALSLRDSIYVRTQEKK